MPRKVAVIGLDGLSWKVLHDLLSKGAMPYLNSIMESSAKGILKSTIPPTTPPAWTSITSGVNPGKHGIYDFVKLTSNYRTKIVTSLDVRYPRIHEMIALMGLETVSINMPFTFPILKIEKSTIVSDWIGPKICFFPKKVGTYMKKYKPYSLSAPSPDKLYKETKNRAESVNTLMNEIEWNLFFVIFMEPDHLMHRYGIPPVRTRIEKHYYKIFTELDKTIENASKIADLLIILSDHGFSEYQYRININSYLARLGFTIGTNRSSVKGIADLKTKKRKVEIKFPPFLYKFIVAHESMKKFVKRVYRLLIGKYLTSKWPRPDPEKSKAFSPTTESCGVYVKDKLLIDTILLELKKLKGIQQVWKREAIYHGPHVNLAPHIIFQPNFDDGFTVGSVLMTPLIFSKGKFYWHHPDGIFILHGKNVHSGWISYIHTVDIVPTILRYIGLPLPIDTDGKPLSNIDYPRKQVEYYDYLKQWKLIRQIQLKKSKLAI